MLPLNTLLISLEDGIHKPRKQHASLPYGDLHLDALQRSTEESVAVDGEGADWVVVGRDCTCHLTSLYVPHLYTVIHRATEQLFLPGGDYIILHHTPGGNYIIILNYIIPLGT